MNPDGASMSAFHGGCGPAAVRINAVLSIFGTGSGSSLHKRIAFRLLRTQ